MSILALAWAKRQRTGSATRKLVLLTLADYADDTGMAWPSQQTLAEDTELNVRSIRRALIDLEKLPLIKRYKRAPMPSGERQSDRIQLLLDTTGQIVRRARDQRTLTTKSRTQSPPNSHGTLPYQVEEQTYQKKALGTQPQEGGPA